ncbi:MAG: DMT family transporter, partial [Candidatus Saccharimonadales bacterium]
VAQAVALKNGGLIIVEPLLTSDLIFLLLIIHFRLNIPIKPRDWLAAAAVMVGLAGIFLAANPKEGHLSYQAFPWIVLAAVAAPLVAVLAVIIRKLKSANLRALLAGIAAATSFAMNAALIKLCFNQYNQHGFSALLSSWPVYAFIVSGITSLYLMVNAYESGPLAISQPVMEVAEPAIAVTIGVMIFGDSYDSSIGAISAGLIFAILLVVGIILLGSSPRVQQAGEQGI